MLSKIETIFYCIGTFTIMINLIVLLYTKNKVFSKKTTILKLVIQSFLLISIAILFFINLLLKDFFDIFLFSILLIINLVDLFFYRMKEYRKIKRRKDTTQQ